MGRHHDYYNCGCGIPNIPTGPGPFEGMPWLGGLVLRYGSGCGRIFGGVNLLLWIFIAYALFWYSRHKAVLGWHINR